jgi:hypothetical protein
MRNKSGQMAQRSRLAVAVGLAVTVAAAACSGGASSVTSPSGVGPSSLAANNGQSTRDFSVTITPTSVQAGAATLHVTVTRDATSGQNQKLGSAEIYVPSAFTIQSVSNISNANWTSGVSGQTVRVGAVGGNHKLDGSAGLISVTFDINVTSTECGTYPFNMAQASNDTYSTDPFSPNWTYTGSPLSVEVTGCDVAQDCKAAPAIANEYLDSINFGGGPGRGDIISSVAHHMTEGARFDGIDKCNIEAYRAAVIAYVIARLPV